MPLPTILVIGGGIASLDLIVHLRTYISSSKPFQLIIVEPKDYLEFSPSLMSFLKSNSSKPHHIYEYNDLNFIPYFLPTSIKEDTTTLGQFPEYDSLSFTPEQRKIYHSSYPLNQFEFNDEPSSLTHVKWIAGSLVGFSTKSALISPSINNNSEASVTPLLSVDYDYMVIGTGLPYPNLIRPTTLTVPYQDRASDLLRLRAELKDPSITKKVVIFGTGFVGIELATTCIEICSTDTMIELRSRSKTVLKSLPKYAQDYAENYLKKNGVNIVYENKESPKQYQDTVSDPTIKVFDCTSCSYNTFPAFPSKYYNLPSDYSIPLIPVDPYLRVLKAPNVFAIGDCFHEYFPWYAELDLLPPIKHSDKSGMYAGFEATIVVKNLIALINSTSLSSLSLSRYPHDLPMISGRPLSNLQTSIPDVLLLPLGKRSGLIIFNHIVLFSNFTVYLKAFIESSKIASYKNKYWGIIFCCLMQFMCLLSAKMFAVFSTSDNTEKINPNKKRD
jgi:NADH dehydrogenase FAD-containing subunit